VERCGELQVEGTIILRQHELAVGFLPHLHPGIREAGGKVLPGSERPGGQSRREGYPPGRK
jgi:hypothetical protein